ncbi:toprim domain-containing protein [bacterium CPR1]|nr:toprim domain-containing protein [bacterium CPR1]
MADNPSQLSRAELDELKARVDLAAVVRAYGVELAARGRNLLGCCPFHADDTPSLSVNPKSRLWQCFGCHAGGDALTFIQLKEGLTFPETVARMREFAGELPATPSRPTTRPGPTTAEDLVLPGGVSRDQILQRVTDHYRRTLLQHHPARQYLRDRGLADPQTWETFGLGFADGSLASRFPSSGEVREALEQLGVMNGDGKERFRGCLVVPLTHPEFGLVGLYGRAIDQAAPLKHLFLPGLRRGMLHWQALQGSPTIWVAEGPLDALSLWQAGLKSSTCLFGLQPPWPDFEELLRRYGVREVRLCLDGDEPGQKALPRLASWFTGQGLQCQTARLPEAFDPNRLLSDQGPAALKQLEQTLRPALDEAAPAPVTEPIPEGVRLVLDGVTYTVIPKPPFNGRLKVTLRATFGPRKCVDRLDLYTNRARNLSAQQLARELGLSKDEVQRHLMIVMEAAEHWVESQARTAEESEDMPNQAAPVLTQAEREEALEWLRRPDLVDAILQDSEDLGYVGESRAKLLGYLIGISRKLEFPLAGVVISQSGAGKSSLTDLVEKLTPPEEAVLYSRVSAQSLYYLPKDFLKRKLLILEERVGAEQADYSIRVLQSRQKLTQLVTIKDPASGKMKTRHYEVEGPIAYLETTTNPRLNHENATRCFELELDESEEQTQRIHARQREDHRRDRRSGHKARSESIRTRHHNAQRLLECVEVVIPYVDHLSFPSRWLRTRRDHKRFLCLIEAVTFLHQHQRSGGALEDGTRYVEATLQDYRLAYELAQDVLRSTLHELSRNSRELWPLIQAWARGKSGQVFTRRELRQETGWPDRRLQEGLQELVELEYLAVLAGSQGRTFQYQVLADVQDAPCPLGELTTPEQLTALWPG